MRGILGFLAFVVAIVSLGNVCEAGRVRMKHSYVSSMRTCQSGQCGPQLTSSETKVETKVTDDTTTHREVVKSSETTPAQSTVAVTATGAAVVVTSPQVTTNSVTRTYSRCQNGNCSSPVSWRYRTTKTVRRK